MSVVGERHKASPCCSGGLGCFFFINEEGRVHALAADVDVGMPQSGSLVPGDTSILGRALPSRYVLGTLGWSTGTEVSPRVVQRISVEMVSEVIVTRAESEQVPMQPDTWAAYDISTCGQIPAVLTGPRDIGGVDGRVILDSSVTREQRNQSRQPVFTQGDHLRMTVALTPRRAEHPILDGRRLPIKFTTPTR